MIDHTDRIASAWKRSMNWLVAAWNDPGPQVSVPADRSAIHARLAADCMRSGILVEYTPGRRLVVESKLGGAEASCIWKDGEPNTKFIARPLNFDWCGKDAIGWGYDL